VRLFTRPRGGGLRIHNPRGILITSAGPWTNPQTGENMVFVYSSESGYSCWLNPAEDGGIEIRRGNETLGRLP
jgi:hypothetical protein